MDSGHTRTRVGTIRATYTAVAGWSVLVLLCFGLPLFLFLCYCVALFRVVLIGEFFPIFSLLFCAILQSSFTFPIFSKEVKCDELDFSASSGEFHEYLQDGPKY